MKWTLIILIILAVPLVSSLEMCEDYVKPNVSCQMTTPPITCTTYNYSLTRENGSFSVGNLTSLVNSIYYFNFTQLEGDYVVSLCDGQVSREIYVQEDDSVSWALALIFAVLGVAGILGMYSLKLDKEHFLLKLFFISVVMLLLVSGLNLSISIAEHAGASTAIVNNISTIYVVGTWVMYLFFAYVVIFYVWFLFKWINDNILKKRWVK